uniref:OBG-type G domain-containing protein n=1 Tax=Rhabditophanes sp. KR3021 TaxID=114890 RepID=A0AC35TJ10_9BILA
MKIVINVFLGFPSVGKSTLLTSLSGVHSEAAAYEFTTLTTVPGVIRYRGAKIQLLDLPGIIENAKDGKGRGKQVIAVARTCSLILICLDVLSPLTQKKILERELEGFGIRLNKSPPQIYFKQKERGGLNLNVMVPQSELDEDLVKQILGEYRIHNADITLKYDASVDDLIDVIEGNRVYIPCIYVLNKIDQITITELDVIRKVKHCCPISAQEKWNFDELLAMIWEYLNLIRVYTKPKGQLPDLENPVILSAEKVTIEKFCQKIHKTMVKDFKIALVWGKSAKHAPMRCSLHHSLCDGDVIQIIKKFYGVKELNKSINLYCGVAYEATVLDVAPHSLGIETTRSAMFVIIKRNTTIPTKTFDFCTLSSDGQPSISICVYQGKYSMTRDNNYIGKLDLSVLSSAAEDTHKVGVIFQVQHNLILKVSAKNGSTGDIQDHSYQTNDKTL